MPLGSALTDRGRVIKTTALDKRVQGMNLTTPTRSAWFKCRLTLSQGQETTGPDEHRRTPRSPQLLVGKKNKDREIISITAEDRVEVRSRQLGEDPVTFEVVGDPEPLRKKGNRLPFGWMVTLERIDEHQAPRQVP